MTLYMDKAAEAELQLLGYGHRESKRAMTRFVALCVASLLIGGLSVFAFVFSHRHASTQTSPVQRLDKLGSYAGSIRLFEVQQQLSAQDVSTLIRATNLASQHIIAELGGTNGVTQAAPRPRADSSITCWDCRCWSTGNRRVKEPDRLQELLGCGVRARQALQVCSSSGACWGGHRVGSVGGTAIMR
jgi:hypothetical protein